MSSDLKEFDETVEPRWPPHSSGNFRAIKKLIEGNEISEASFGLINLYEMSGIPGYPDYDAYWPLVEALQEKLGKKWLRKFFKFQVSTARQILTSELSAETIDREKWLKLYREFASWAYKNLIKILETSGNISAANFYSNEIQALLNGTKIAPRYPKTTQKIDDDTFWKLLSYVKRSDDVALDELISRLESYKLPQIKAFQKLLDEKLSSLRRSDIWAVGFIVNGGLSDDGFDYFRAWIVLQGKEFFESMLNNPEGTATKIKLGSEVLSEDLLYVAEEATLANGGEWIPPKLAKQTALKLDWSEKDLPKRYPKLWKKFNK